MSMEIDSRLKNIQSKLLQVLKEYQVLQKENARLRNDLSRSQQENAEKSAHIQALQQQVDVIKLGVSGWSGHEKAELEKRIDVYLKEIDKCLTLLNN